MKFAHYFKAELTAHGFPQHWVDSAVPYPQLKKIIKKVKLELKEIGLDITTFAQLIPNSDEETQHVRDNDRRGSADGVVTFKYDLCNDQREFRPKLTFFFEDEQAVDATLSPETRNFLEKLAIRRGSLEDAFESSARDISDNGLKVSQGAENLDGPVLRQIEIPLTSDTEFFRLIQEDVANLDNLQTKEQKVMSDEIVELSKEVAVLAKPSKFSKTDMNRWRQLFDLYLQAGVFFSTNELDHGSRDSTVAARQLDWFQSEVDSRGLVKSFKLPASRQALQRFVKINITLLQNLKFQEINQKAIGKILKKFDKRTRLGAARTFPQHMQSDYIMSETMAKAVCAQVTQDLIKITPQLDDYLCPICFTILWRPIRMKCQHIFCIRCTLEMQKQRKIFCPLCRGKVIMEADQDNIDRDLAKFLVRYFRREVLEKQVELETAAGIEQFGIFYKHPGMSWWRKLSGPPM